ncbi:hypothetical protein JTB14_025335 [Gonioctena quinquepunctata]|nr:hypothetical protein JTB14_025335 [Gonioctena quinquepunctata]
MQWNARSAVSNKYSLQKFLSENSIDLGIISETWFKPDNAYVFAGFNLIRNDRYDGKGGTALLINKKYAYQEITIDNNIHPEISYCGANVKFSNEFQPDIISLYRGPNIRTSNNDWVHIFRKAKTPCLICGDFNAHNGVWGSNRNDNVSQQILHAVDECDLVILNNGEKTRPSKPNEQKSAVDISLCSVAIAPLITWSVSQDTLGSDHFPITMDIQLNSAENDIVYPKNKWDTKRVDWNIYQSYCVELFSEHTMHGNTEEKYACFINKINLAADFAIPAKKTFRIKNKLPPPWWDSECDAAIEKRKLSLSSYKTFSSWDNYVQCDKTHAETKKISKSKARRETGYPNSIETPQANTYGNKLNSFRESRLIQKNP